MIYIIIAAMVIIGILVTLASIFIYRKRKANNQIDEPDYKVFYILGLALLPLGIVFTAAISPAFIGFIGIGGAYLAIGLGNKDKWKE